MKFYLVIFSCDYADEFDVRGAEVYVGTEESYFAHTSDVKFPREVYFGTNEAVYYQSLEDYKRCFKFKECSESFYYEMLSLTGGSGETGSFCKVEY